MKPNILQIFKILEGWRPYAYKDLMENTTRMII